MEACSWCGMFGALHEASYVQKKYGAEPRKIPGKFCSYSCYDQFCQDVDRGVDAMGEFPAHDHVWEVLLIENNPVGVTCKICDETMHTVKEKPQVQIIKGKDQVLDLRGGSIVKMRNGQHEFIAVMDSVEMRTERHGDVDIAVNFRVRNEDYTGRHTLDPYDDFSLADKYVQQPAPSRYQINTYNHYDSATPLYAKGVISKEEMSRAMGLGSKAAPHE